jgi:hypothetical protein
MTPLTLLFFAAMGLAFIDAARRPASQWLLADRNRAFWLVLIVFLNIFGACLYALFVFPRFPRGSADVDATLLKSAVRPNRAKE